MAYARKIRSVYATIVISISAIAAQSAIAADWWWIDVSGHKPTRDVIFIDKETIKKTTIGKVDAWEEDYHESTQNDGAKSSKVLFEYDCNVRTVSMISYIDYDTNGNVISNNTVPSYSRPASPVAPDTIGEAELEFVCGDATKGTHLGANLDIMSVGPGMLYVLDHPSPAPKP